MKKLATLNGNGIYLVGKKIVLHYDDCLERNPGCKYHSATATRRQLQLMISGKAKRFQGYNVVYPRKGIVKVGCTAVKLSLLKRLEKQFDNPRK